MKKEHVTLEQEFELLGSINELVIKTRELISQLEIAPVRVHELKNALRETQRIAQDHYMACEIAMTRDLADTFPDGSEAPAVLTPRQVMYLAALSYQHPSRELVGLPASRTCLAIKASGFKCAGYSLVFTERAVCSSHASPAERERNRKAKEQWNIDHPDYSI